MDATGVRFEGRTGGRSMGRRRRKKEGEGASYIVETITKGEDSPVCVKASLYGINAGGNGFVGSIKDLCLGFLTCAWLG
jgi:hypothetical protein